MSGYARPLIIPAASTHTATVIWLHGYGDNGAGWFDSVYLWRELASLDEAKLVLPHAPIGSVAINPGSATPSWFNVKVFGGDLEAKQRHEDEPSVLKACDYVHSLVQKEIDGGIPPERIVLGGFSQGGAVCIIAGLISKFKIAAIISLSSFFLLSQRLPDLVPTPQHNKETPIFMCHGDIDRYVSADLANESCAELRRQGYNATLKVYPNLAHKTSSQEMHDVAKFLESRLPALGSGGPVKSEL